MATKIVTKNSSTGGAVPSASDLVQGELAVNVADKRLFTEDNGGSIIELGTNPSTIDINAGSIDGTAIGASSASTGAFTTLTATGIDVTGTATMDGLTVGIADYIILDGGSAGEVIRTPIAGTLTLESRGSVDIYGDSNNNGTSTSDVFRVLRDSTYVGGTGKVALKVDDSGDISFYEDTGTTAKLFWDASAESLGIGTSSPSSTLDLHSSTNGHGLFIAQDNAGYAYHTRLTFQGSNGSGGYNTIAGLKAYQETNGTNGYLRFDTNGENERMRIDSSGNLLVGTTSIAVGQGTSTGVSVRGPIGRVEASASGTTSAIFNRTTSDGNIVNFAKDGTTVGSIGTAGGDLLVGTGDTHLRFNDGAPAIYTTNASGTPIDADADLGASSARFKDLYLSGGVYLGGTGSANKLDDYESGTFTLSPSAGTLTYLYSSTSTYTKIGNRVIIDLGQIRITGVPNNSTGFTLSGLPFTTQGQSSLAVGWVNKPFGTTNSDMWFNMYIEDNKIYVGKRNSDYLLRNEDITGETIEFSAGGSAYRTS